ncbi:Winged helix DNA-binding domain superfamily [Arabidopsis suecica]|uniref:Winged helix DNA-binding domain superfamily n=1 Tax=Arabidopsis suecica TaxID=45249 RepID=A0A8T2BXS4_ARASU|nr:Winged helix DNA-binding domain superfamily [Arabidopsis suecica]
MTNHLQDSLTTYPKPVLTKEEQEVDEKMVSLQAESIVNTVAFPMVLKAAFELGVIDTITDAGNDTWLSPYEIARSLPTKPTNPEAPVLLDRMLRLLVSHSILKCRMIETGENGRTGKIERVYAAEPVCKYFLRDNDGSGSLVSLFMLLHTEVFFKTWTNLKDVILEGRDAFNSAHGMKIFEYIYSHEQFAELFNRAMSEPSTMIMKKVLELYRGFEDVNTLVDVGGGNGTVLGLVTSKYPHIKGVNFDLAQVLTQAPFYPGVEHVPGDMFIQVPKGDAVFMKVSLYKYIYISKVNYFFWVIWFIIKNGKLLTVDTT